MDGQQLTCLPIDGDTIMICGRTFTQDEHGMFPEIPCWEIKQCGEDKKGNDACAVVLDRMQYRLPNEHLSPCFLMNGRKCGGEKSLACYECVVKAIIACNTKKSAQKFIEKQKGRVAVSQQ